MPEDDPTISPDRIRARARHHAYRVLIVRLLARSRWFGLRLPGNRLRHVCVRLRAVFDTAGPLPDEAAFLALCGALERLLDIANAYALVRDDLTPKQQATHFRRAAEHLGKARVILTMTGEPPWSVVREENSTLLVAAIEDIRREDSDAADQGYRDQLASLVLLEQELRRAAELATRPPWSMRVRTTTWPPGLMKKIVHIWTTILGRTAGASIRIRGDTDEEVGSPLIKFAKACLELLGLPKSAQSAKAIRVEYRRHGQMTAEKN